MSGSHRRKSRGSLRLLSLLAATGLALATVPAHASPLTPPAPRDAQAAAAAVGPQIVDIDAKLGFQSAIGAGTGIVIDPSVVLTNNHVIAGATDLTARSIANGQTYPATVIGFGFGILLIGGIGNVSAAGFTGLAQANAGGNVQGLAALIFTKYLWAFELTGALLITAALGAMVLAHRERFERRKTQREMAADRFQPGGHPGTLPNPGVYARHNAVDVPARLPDGTGSELSVSAILQKRPVTQTNGRNGHES